MPLFPNKPVLSFKEIHILAPKLLSLISGRVLLVAEKICAFVGWRGGERVNEVSLNQLSSFPF